ncbi:hypothetical protein PIB30_093690, partial [Stylosanthes scabra]|nr:hypothetical protein [Stylosanthes scabra]
TTVQRGTSLTPQARPQGSTHHHLTTLRPRSAWHKRGPSNHARFKNCLSQAHSRQRQDHALAWDKHGSTKFRPNQLRHATLGPCYNMVQTWSQQAQGLTLFQEHETQDL